MIKESVLRCALSPAGLSILLLLSPALASISLLVLWTCGPGLRGRSSLVGMIGGVEYTGENCNRKQEQPDCESGLLKMPFNFPPRNKTTFQKVIKVRLLV